MNVYMDDQRSCPYGYVLATTVESALQFVRSNKVNILSLDFNMGWRKRNGLDFVEGFCTEGLYVNEIHLHTNDVIGMHQMKQRIEKRKEKGEIDPHIALKYVGG
ncbi:cyclic-phosphate processing receiver domain-containing protein [Bacillus mycoides]|uniref:cyclic-phosphate processing receiver domain-containing protein n=1 Tax=Bacillus mycoides TaxID=1405 RepID=UPI0011A53E5E|nr:cyclic-phosphate processing receiver domain-containing protein [Bacillus mycoides]